MKEDAGEVAEVQAEQEQVGGGRGRGRGKEGKKEQPAGGRDNTVALCGNKQCRSLIKRRLLLSLIRRLLYPVSEVMHDGGVR